MFQTCARNFPVWAAVFLCWLPAGCSEEVAPLSSGGCTVFPADHPWNTDISQYPVHKDSDLYMGRLALTWGLEFVDNLPINVINRVTDNVPMVAINYITYQGDPGPMPIPPDAVYHVKDPAKLVTEDNHLVLKEDADCRMYELWSIAGPSADGSWDAGSGAIFDLLSNTLRPDHAPSSSASGMSVFAGIARADETRLGAIPHALAIPATFTQEAFLHPATSFQADSVYQYKFPLACGTANYPFAQLCADYAAGIFNMADPYNAPMGLRIRLKGDYDLSGVTGEAAIILQAAKTYGLFITDGSGTAGLLKGELVADPAVWDWSNTINRQLSAVPATAFEVVETGALLR